MFKYILIALVLIAVIYSNRSKVAPALLQPREGSTETGITEVKNNNEDIRDFEVIAQNLSVPWDIAFLPEGDLLVTERGGKLKKVGKETKVVAEIGGVKQIGEGGLLGMAIDPNYSENRFIYLYSTSQNSGGVFNRIERYKLSNDVLSDQKVILDSIKGSKNHDGGRIAFGPDGYLYVATGDAENANSAQDKNSLNGKILRIDGDGKSPSDNPFGNAVYSYGHRNPQGLAWDTIGRLWSSEHGPSGAQTGNDEINLITKSGNYGWPEIRGKETKEGMITPIIESGKNDTWAPASLTYLNDTLFFGGLRGQALYQAKITDEKSLALTTNLKNQFGRIRTVIVGPDGNLYITTSNTDGRGTPKKDDDKIIRVSAKKLLLQ